MKHQSVPHKILILDRAADLYAYVTFGGEAVDNSICIDDKGGIYVVTSKRMLRLAWTGKKLSTKEADGAWESPYEAMDPEKAMAMGALSRGSGTTPTLMGFGDDPDKLVLIADAAEEGTHLVAFWREAIPDDFVQKPGTLSRRIADQIRIDISKLTSRTVPQRPRLWCRRDQWQLSRSVALTWRAKWLHRGCDATRPARRAKVYLEHEDQEVRERLDQQRSRQLRRHGSGGLGCHRPSLLCEQEQWRL
jgi:hypothetical protein